MRFDAGSQSKLHQGPIEVVALSIRFEVAVSIEVISEKAQPQFKRNQADRIKEVAVVGFAQGLSCCFQVAAQNRFAALEVKHHLFGFKRFLSQGVATGTQAIADVVMHQAWFHSVEIHQGNGSA